MVERRRARRTRKRLTCELRVGAHGYGGIILDVSANGLFIRTSATPPRGAVVDVRITGGTALPEIALRARVVRQKRVDPRLATVAASGIGLEIIEAPEAYYRELVGEDPPGATARAAPTPPPCEPPADPAADPLDLEPFKVRVSQVGGTRSRILKLEAEDEEAARTAALAEVGEGWEVVEVNRG